MQVSHLQNELERARRHIARAKEIIARQIDVVDALGEAGYGGAEGAEHTLKFLIGTLKSLKDRERLLLKEIEGAANLRKWLKRGDNSARLNIGVASVSRVLRAQREPSEA